MNHGLKLGVMLVSISLGVVLLMLGLFQKAGKDE
jgi:hypothetical protein